MTKSIEVYGFGSHFQGNTTPKDIDLLIIHTDISRLSIDFAIACKSEIKHQLAYADVIMLSVQEEREKGFIRKSDAVHLCKIIGPDLRLQVQWLATQLV